MPSRRLRDFGVVLAVAAAYYLGGKIGLRLAFVNASATAVWPPTGIALAALIVFGYRAWPGVLIGAFLVNVSTAGTIASSVGIALGNTLEALLGTWLVRQFAHGRRVFEQPRDIVKYVVLVGGLSTSVSATVGATSLVLSGLAAWADFRRIWVTWWLGDTAAALVIAPFLLLWSLQSRIAWSPRRFMEASLLILALTLAGLFVFAGESPFGIRQFPVTFVVFPILIWAAFRFGPRAVAALLVLLSGFAVWGALHGLGPFVLDDPNDALLTLQAFLAVSSVLSLTVAATVSQRKRAEARVRSLNEELEERVLERTRQLSASYKELRDQSADRERARKHLAESEARLREAHSVARLGSWEWDVRTNAVWWSEELFSLYGLTAGAFGGTVEAFLDLVHPADREHVRRQVEGALARGGSFEFEHRIIRPDRQVLTIQSRGRTITDHEGAIVRMSGTGQDITERKVAEEQRARLLEEQIARREAEETNRLKDEFLAMLSHELRTPLNAIVGWAEMLRTGQLDQETTIRAIDVIRRNVRAQDQLLSDLLDLSRLASGKIVLKEEQVALATVVERALDTMRPGAAARNIRLEADLDHSLPPLKGDAQRLEQVVWNLLSNAIEFSTDGGTVRVTLAGTAHTAILRVEDEGPGIEAEFLPHMFDRYRRGKSPGPRKHNGLGLGLAIVKHLVELHGGTVAAGNREGGAGAVFTVTLALNRIPRRRIEDDRVSVGAAALEPRADERRRPLAGIRIMIVEDEVNSREPIALLFGNRGAEVLAVGSCAEAMGAITRYQPDVLISDIEMPGETGYDLIARVRELPACEGGRVPAIALTAYAGSEHAERALRSGYQAHATKPVQFDALVDLVASLAGKTIPNDAEPV